MSDTDQAGTSQRPDVRVERDTMGEVEVPGWAYWGAQTQRAVQNFSVSELRIPPPLIRALGLVKRFAAQANGELGLLPAPLAAAIADAATEVAEGRWDDHFPVDVFQTGSGTSWNMNANEVVAARAAELLAERLGEAPRVHPNDHVNRGQSSNDVIPTAIHLAVRMEAGDLTGALQALRRAFEDKAVELDDVVRIGRTHLQDAVPVTLGQTLRAYATQVRKGAERVEATFARLEELALGGTALGTGVNAHPELAPRVIARLARHLGVPFRPADDRFEAISARDASVELMGALNTVAVSLMKIANDLRLMSSGPRAGLGELTLPALQPGSSIMPGKVNPVIPEMVVQACAFVMGKHLSVTIAGQNAPLELNIMMPLIAHETLAAVSLLANVSRAFAERCVAGLDANRERCAELIAWSLAMVTPLATRIGYDRAARIAYRASAERRTVRDVALEEGVMTAAELDTVLDPMRLARPGDGGQAT